MARPMPLAAPVTTAQRPGIFMFIVVRLARVAAAVTWAAIVILSMGGAPGKTLP
jgi:hypothetical protein